LEVLSDVVTDELEDGIYREKGNNILNNGAPIGMLRSKFSSPNSSDTFSS
jgi:hypothetical protein